MSITRKSAKKQKAGDFNILSDDIIDDVMAGLPDLDGLPKSSIKMAKVDVFEDGAAKLGEADPASNEPAASQTRPSMTSKHDVHQSSRMQKETSKAAAEEICANVKTHMLDLKANFAYTPPTDDKVDDSSMKVPSRFNSRIPLAVKKNLSSGQSSRTPIPGTKKVLGTSLHMQRPTGSPLQRLGISALQRAHSYNGAPKRSNLKTVDTAEKIPKTSPPTVSSTLPSGPPVDAKTQVGSCQITPPLALIQGSEDLMVPDSEEETSSSEDVASPPRSINLSAFAFVAGK
jgi:hypothetical protein